ncbi:MAG: ribonuclease III, partial [Candidatus Competibacteraceae bacterium]|nr:ribonuclease III [Candidatus Competibacteraceae bacterium]
DTLCRRLGYTFTDDALLRTALTHRSAAGTNNERLEFLGDSILNFVIAEALFEHYPKAREGELSRLRASLVKGDTLADAARAIELGDYLNLGSGELKSGGFRRDSILADALEALLAAVYLDSDFATCRALIRRLFGQQLAALPAADQLKDPKTRLQEALQARQQALPVYDVLAVSGEPHDQKFTVRCTIDNGLVTVAEGASRRKAEQEAARQALRQL